MVVLTFGAAAAALILAGFCYGQWRASAGRALPAESPFDRIYPEKRWWRAMFAREWDGGGDEWRRWAARLLVTSVVFSVAFIIVGIIDVT